MKVRLTSPGAKVPVRADDGSAGFDLFVPYDIEIRPGRNLIPLYIQIELDHHTEAQIRPRSGFSLKGMEGYAVDDAETPRRYDADVILGTVDESYRGTVGVIVKSYEREPFIVKAGTRIAQMVISRYRGRPFEVAAELSGTERGEQGFGHTGAR